MPEPKVSIIIPAFNAGEYLGTCLETVLNQTLPETEVICVDDGSTDQTSGILLSYARRYPQLKTISFPQRQGTLKARNAGVEAAQGQYILFCDADDHLAPETAETVYREIKNRDCTALMFGFEVISSTEAENKKYAQSTRNIFKKKILRQELLTFYFSMEHTSRGTLCGWGFESSVVKAACRMIPEAFCCVNEDAIVLFVILTLCESADGIKNRLYIYQRMIGITGRCDTFETAAFFLENFHTSITLLEQLLPQLETQYPDPPSVRQAYRNFLKKHLRYMCQRRLKRPGMTEEEHLELTRRFYSHCTAEDFADAVVYRHLKAPSYSKLNLLASSGLLPEVPLCRKKIESAAISFGDITQDEAMQNHLKEVITVFRQLKIMPVLISDSPQNGDFFYGIKLHRINAGDPLSRMEELRRIISEKEIGLYYSNTGNALADSLVCRLIAGIPAILHRHDSFAREIADDFDFSWYRNAEKKFFDLILCSSLESEAFYRMNEMPAFCCGQADTEKSRLELWKDIFKRLERSPRSLLELNYTGKVTRQMLDILRLQTITGLTGKIQLPKAEAAKNKKLLAKEQQKSLKLAKKCQSLEKKLFLLQAAEPEKES